MKLINTIVMGVCILLSLIGCSKTEDTYQYTGENKVYITSNGDKSLTIDENNQAVVAQINLTTRVKATTNIHLKAIDAQGQTSSLINFSENPVQIAKDTRGATFTVTLKENISLNQEQRLKITFETVQGFVSQENLEIVLKPKAAIGTLSTAQQQLLEAYKAKGIDLSPFIGKIKVKGTVFSPAGGNTAPFANEFTREINGSSLITLSNLATANTPILKMVDNPMGLTEFWHFLLKKNTIEDDEFFPELPVAQALMPLINWNKNSQETLKVTLDNLIIQAPVNGVSKVNFIHKTKDLYDELKDMVPFEFSYTAWDRLKKLIEAKNPVALENYNQNGAPNPIYYLNTSDILRDEYEGGTWKASSGNIDFTNKKMTFEFLISHTMGSDYLIVKIEYTAE